MYAGFLRVVCLSSILGGVWGMEPFVNAGTIKNLIGSFKGAAETTVGGKVFGGARP